MMSKPKIPRRDNNPNLQVMKRKIRNDLKFVKFLFLSKKNDAAKLHSYARLTSILIMLQESDF